MVRLSRLVSFALLGGMFAFPLRSEELRREEPQEPGVERGVVNWPAPLFWSGGDAVQASRKSKEGLGTTPAVVNSTSPLPLIGITPCRVVDTRDASMPLDYGPPALAPGLPNLRSFVMAGHC